MQIVVDPYRYISFIKFIINSICQRNECATNFYRERQALNKLGKQACIFLLYLTAYNSFGIFSLIQYQAIDFWLIFLNYLICNYFLSISAVFLFFK